METWNDPKTVINQNVPVDTQNKLLIEKLLDTLATIESPMANLLIHEGNAELLMGYLTRNTNNNDNQLCIVRPNELNVDLKRAYQVVQLFTQNSKAFAIFVSVRINNIVSSLFNIFRKDSVGSFHHWKAVFEILLESHPTKVASLISENNAFLQYFYDFIHEETVSEALFVLLTSNKLVINDRKKLYSKFNEIKFIQRVVSEKLFNPDGDHAVITNFLLSFFRRMMVIQTSSAIFNHISKSTYFMMTELMNAFPNKNYTEVQKKWVAHLIKNLFLLCKQDTLETSATHTPPQKINNYLTPFFDTFVTQAKNALTGLLDSLVLTNHLGREDEQKDTFTEYRLYLLQVLSFLVNDEDLSILSKFSLPLWKSLVKWFFMHANNNIYHSLFYKFWRACLQFNNEPIFRILFSKCKFVNRLLTHYETNPTSPLNGFILLICNTIRFSSSLQSTNKFFSDYISSNQPFSKFVPTIIEQTSKQAVPYKCDTIKLPYPHFQPYQKETVVQNMFSEKIEGNLDIELGSLYAHIVGFNQPPKEKPLVITPRNNNNDDDTNILVKEIEGMSISNNNNINNNSNVNNNNNNNINTNNLLKELSLVSSSPKKKNKKKNKKKGGGNKGNNNVPSSPVKGSKNGEKN